MPAGPVDRAADPDGEEPGGDGAARFVAFAEAHAAAGDDARAAAAFSVALRFEPRSVAALAGLGRVHLRTGDLDAARRVLYGARELAPGDALVARLVAELLSKLGKHGRAADEFARAMEIEADRRR